MAILKVARMGHPVLRETGRAVHPEELSDPEVQRLIENMVETMAEYSGVGLAAPQVHFPLRIVVIGASEEGEEEEEGEGEVMALINPEIRPVSETQVCDWEGCLSIPDIRGLVPRWEAIAVRALSVDGQAVEFEARGFGARVIQHEVDHLDGILFPDRMEDLKSLTFTEEYLRYVQEEV